VSRNRLLAWVAVLATLVSLLVVATVDDSGPPTPGERASTLYQRFACPECAGQAISESNAPVARNMREFIDAQIQVGRSDADIEAALVAAYPGSLLVPPSSGFGALAWVLPVVGFAAGATALAWVVTRDRGRVPVHASDADRDLVERARRAPR
jgi:cytochrome c-type biogenesis protein CcmH/NrfF